MRASSYLIPQVLRLLIDKFRGVTVTDWQKLEISGFSTIFCLYLFEKDNTLM